jgi:hypothetical protein
MEFERSRNQRKGVSSPDDLKATIQNMCDTVLTPYLQSHNLLPRAPPLRYFQHPSKLFQYAWNTEPLTPTEETRNKRWVAIMYKRKGDTYLATKMRHFTTRKSAKVCARRWYDAARNRIEKKNSAANVIQPKTSQG